MGVDETEISDLDVGHDVCPLLGDPASCCPGSSFHPTPWEGAASAAPWVLEPGGSLAPERRSMNRFGKGERLLRVHI